MSRLQRSIYLFDGKVPVALPQAFTFVQTGDIGNRRSET